MSLSKWKELAKSKTAVGEMKKNLFDQITAEKIRSKTTDEAIAKTFRLDRLDQIAEQTKPKAKRQGRLQIPRINRAGGIDYAPEVDPYEDMDVEGVLNLEDYVAPQVEKQIAKMPKEAPKYEMDPSFWQLTENLDPPPLYEEKDPLAIGGPEGPDGAPEEENDEMDTSYLQLEPEEDPQEDEGEEDLNDENKTLDNLDLRNYDDVDKTLNQDEMTETEQRKYLRKIIKDAETRRRQVIAMKSNATKSFNAGKITEAEKKAHNKSDRLRKTINDYIQHYKSEFKTIKGSGRSQRGGQRGRGTYSF